MSCYAICLHKLQLSFYVRTLTRAPIPRPNGADSVLVGDALFNGDKIDKQVVNDPKAIAKAAIEAYKAGRTDVHAVELDF